MSTTSPSSSVLRGASWLALGACCAAIPLSGACGGDDDALVARAGDVVHQCTRQVYARQPFGSLTPVDRYAISFEIPEGTTSFLIAGHDEGASTTLASVVSPRGFTYDLVTDDSYARFHPAAMASLYGVPIDVDRLMIPPAPGFEFMLEPGVWEVRGDTGSGRFCVSIAAADAPGTTLRLVVYLVGVEGLTSVSAATHGDWQQVLTRVNDVFSEAGLAVDITGVPYVELGLIETTRFGVLRSWRDFQELVATSQSPGSGPLVLNVFLVRGFGGDLPAGLLGVSSGVPGAAGIHGTSDSGIVFGVQDYLGAPDVGEGVSGNEFLGDVMAHEIGHYLGLFHTTEIAGGVDPLDDTPACPGFDRLASERAVRSTCDDVSNLMFPIALPGAGTSLSAMQVHTLRSSPLMRPF